MGNTTALNSAIPADREKYWKDLTSDEKIERLREQVRIALNNNQNLREEVYNLTNKLNNHEHVNGRLMLDAKLQQPAGYGLGLKSTSSNPENVYF